MDLVWGECHCCDWCRSQTPKQEDSHGMKECPYLDLVWEMAKIPSCRCMPYHQWMESLKTFIM